jgi:hypothetical protein
MTYADAIIAAATAITVTISASLMVYHTNDEVPLRSVAGSVRDSDKGDKLDSIERRLDEAVARQKEIIIRIEKINAAKDAKKLNATESGTLRDEN